MFVTTYTNKEEGCKGTFIRLNATHHGATQEALKDTKETLDDYYANHVADQVIETSGGEDDTDNPSVIRIINPNNGYEYEAYIIEEHIVNE